MNDKYMESFEKENSFSNDIFCLYGSNINDNKNDLFLENNEIEEISTNGITPDFNNQNGNKKENNNNNIKYILNRDKGRRKKNSINPVPPIKSWKHPMNIWKWIRVRINNYLFEKLNMLSNEYLFSKFFKFSGDISTNKEDNESLLNGTIKEYIIKSGINNKYNLEKINNKINEILIEKILTFEKSKDIKPFTNFMNMKFKKFYFKIFICKNKNYRNTLPKKFYQYLEKIEKRKRKRYKKVARRIYQIFKKMISKKKRLIVNNNFNYF